MTSSLQTVKNPLQLLTGAWPSVLDNGMAGVSESRLTAWTYKFLIANLIYIPHAYLTTRSPISPALYLPARMPSRPKCHTCQVGFEDWLSLFDHRRIIDGDQAYQCPLCLYVNSSRRYILERHVPDRHPNVHVEMEALIILGGRPQQRPSQERPPQEPPATTASPTSGNPSQCLLVPALNNVHSRAWQPTTDQSGAPSVFPGSKPDRPRASPPPQDGAK